MTTAAISGVGLDRGARQSYRFFTMKNAAAVEEPCCVPAAPLADLRPIEGREADEELAALA